jgi:catechol 2,3-dioxygenase-like lactoylglutathione lyase family enzyme
MNCTHVRLMVDGFNTCFRFYLEKIGLPTTYPPDASGPYAEFALGGDKYLGLFERALMQDALDAPAAAAREGSSDRVALCFEVADVDVEAKRLASLGVEIAVAPRDHEPWGMRTTYVRDPAGNLIELYSGLKGQAPVVT